jgi:hypothetical protein
MPYITSLEREEFLQILGKPDAHYTRLVSNWFDRQYIPDDDNGERYVRPGMIVARNTDTNKYVPYSSGGSYGTGSDTAVGVLDTFEIVTLGDTSVAPVYTGEIIEQNAYVFGGTLGSISAGIKSALTQIAWV